MRVLSLLSWYEESPAWLAECVASAARICDHIIAVDGPYSAFPGAHKKPFSGTEQADAIIRTAAGCGIGATVHAPRQPWWGPNGGEVAKRDFMFQLGLTFAEPGDWFFRIDADEVLTNVPHDVHQKLSTSKHDVAEILIWEREANSHINELVDAGGDYESPFRCLYRAIPGIRIEQAHFIVTAPINGKREFLTGPKQVPAEPLWEMRLEHRTRLRPPGRQRLKAEYSELINTFEKVEDKPRD